MCCGANEEFSSCLNRDKSEQRLRNLGNRSPVANKVVKPYIDFDSSPSHHGTQMSEDIDTKNAKLKEDFKKCDHGHRIRFFPSGYQKPRHNHLGMLFVPSSTTISCAICRQTAIITRKGYYSCSQKCDYDVCIRCAVPYEPSPKIKAKKMFQNQNETNATMPEWTMLFDPDNNLRSESTKPMTSMLATVTAVDHQGTQALDTMGQLDENLMPVPVPQSTFKVQKRRSTLQKAYLSFNYDIWCSSCQNRVDDKTVHHLDYLNEEDKSNHLCRDCNYAKIIKPQ